MSRNRGNRYRPSKLGRHDRAPEPAPSSNIEAFEYRPGTGQLIVTYRGGRRYAYADVPADIHEGLKAAESKGRFIHTQIIDKFAATRMDLDD